MTWGIQKDFSSFSLKNSLSCSLIIFVQFMAKLFFWECEGRLAWRGHECQFSFQLKSSETAGLQIPFEEKNIRVNLSVWKFEGKTGCLQTEYMISGAVLSAQSSAQICSPFLHNTAGWLQLCRVWPSVNIFKAIYSLLKWQHKIVTTELLSLRNFKYHLLILVTEAMFSPAFTSPKVAPHAPC